MEKIKPLEGFYSLEMRVDLGLHCTYVLNKNNINTKIMYNAIINMFSVVSSECK